MSSILIRRRRSSCQSNEPPRIRKPDMTENELSVDCHAHIIDPARFPFTGTRGYRPRFGEHGTREEFGATLDQHAIGRGLLVQLSGYETNNSAILDAVKTYP